MKISKILMISVLLVLLTSIFTASANAQVPCLVKVHVTYGGSGVGGASVSDSNGHSVSDKGNGLYTFAGIQGQSGTVTATYNGRSASQGYSIGTGSSVTTIDVYVSISKPADPTGTPNPTDQPVTPGGGSQLPVGETIDMSSFYIRVTEYPSATPIPATPTPEPTVEATPVPATPTPTAEPATPTPTPVPTTTAQTSIGDYWWLLLLLILVVAGVVGYYYYKNGGKKE